MLSLQKAMSHVYSKAFPVNPHLLIPTYLNPNFLCPINAKQHIVITIVRF